MSANGRPQMPASVGNRYSRNQSLRHEAPGIKRCRAMWKTQTRTVFSASGLEAASVLRISPVEAHQGRHGFGGLWLHV
jgi:hypothetical protein